MSTFFYISKRDYKNEKYNNKEHINMQKFSDELKDQYDQKNIYILDDQNNKYVFRNNQFELKYNQFMSKWHQKWQNYFDIKYTEKTIENHRTDILIHNICIEFQHSPINIIEVNDRTKCYENNGKNVIWVLDFCEKFGEKKLYVPEDNIIHILSERNKNFISQFKDLKYCYVDYNKKVLCLKMNKLDRASSVYEFKVNGYIDRKCFVDLLIKSKLDLSSSKNFNKLLLSEHFGKIYINQRGAGSGKTWESIQLLNLNDTFLKEHENYEKYINKQNFIYLTKLHSARQNIMREFKDQLKNNQLENIIKVSINNDNKSSKYDIITCHNSQYDKDIKIIIATFDSFLWNTGNKTMDVLNLDMFKNIVEETKKPKKSFKNIDLNNSLIIIDEAQDLEMTYSKYLNMITNFIKCDFHLIGDQLQSIWFENNIYSHCKKLYDACTDKKSFHIQYDIGENKCRRFVNKANMKLVNNLIPFQKFGLKKITGIGKRNDVIIDETPQYIVLNKFYKYNSKVNDNVLTHHINVKYLNDDVRKIIQSFEELNSKTLILPNDFLIICPVVSKGDTGLFVSNLCIALEDFWITLFNNDEYKEKIKKQYKKNNTFIEYYYNIIKNNKPDSFCQLHKSEEGRPIDINESRYKTRILSIHSSKGLTSKYVFLIGLDDNILMKWTNNNKNLQYYSFIHVALTRQTNLLFLGITKNHNFFKEIERESTKSSESMLKKWNDFNDCIEDLSNDKNFCNKVYSKLSIEKKYNNNKKIIKKDDNMLNLIDYNDHIMRYNVMCYKMIIDFLQIYDSNNRINKKQLYAKHCNLNINTKICDIKDYYKYTQKINKYNKNWRVRNEWSNKSISLNDLKCPILKQSNKYEKCSTYVEKIFNNIQKKIFDKTGRFNPENLSHIKCPIELIILFYFFSYMDFPYNTNNTVNDLYKIIYYWYDNFHNNTEHTKYDCLCFELFKQQKDDDKYTKFYKSLDMMDVRFKNLDVHMQDKTIKYGNCYYIINNFLCLFNECFIDISDDTNYDIIIPKQNLCVLEFDKLYVRCLLTHAFLNIRNKKDNNVTFIIFTLNLDPIYIRFSKDCVDCVKNDINQWCIRRLKKYNDDFMNDIMAKSLDQKIDAQYFHEGCEEYEITENDYPVFYNNVILQKMYGYIFSVKFDDDSKNYPEYLINNIKSKLFVSNLVKSIENGEDVCNTYKKYLDKYVDKSFNIYKFGDTIKKI